MDSCQICICMVLLIKNNGIDLHMWFLNFSYSFFISLYYCTIRDVFWLTRPCWHPLHLASTKWILQQITVESFSGISFNFTFISQKVQLPWTLNHSDIRSRWTNLGGLLQVTFLLHPELIVAFLINWKFQFSLWSNKMHLQETFQIILLQTYDSKYGHSEIIHSEEYIWK